MRTRRRNLRIALAAGVVALAAVAAGGYVWIRSDPETIEGSREGFIETEAPPQDPVPAGSWPEYGYDERRTRSNEALELAPPFREKWRFAAQSLLEFPPVIADGRVILGTNDGRALAIDVRDGRRIWQTRLAGQMASSPAIAGDRAFFTTTRGRLVALDTATGTRRWNREIGAASESSPLVIDGSVYVGTLDGDVLRVDAATGRQEWRTPAAGEVKSSLAAAGENVVVGDYAGRITAFARSDGRRVWQTTSPGPRFRGPGRFYAGPAVAYGRVYLGNVNARVLALQADSGELAWVRTVGDFVYSSAAVSRQTVYVGSYDHKLHALDAVTGKPRWAFDAGERISGSPSVIGRLVYVSTLARGGRKGVTYALDAASGRQVWSFPDGRYSPAVAVEGTLILVGRQVLYGLVPAEWGRPGVRR
jgi:outer membrane protein assembly factor BamB